MTDDGRGIFQRDTLAMIAVGALLGGGGVGTLGSMVNNGPPITVELVIDDTVADRLDTLDTKIDKVAQDVGDTKERLARMEGVRSWDSP